MDAAGRPLNKLLRLLKQDAYERIGPKLKRKQFHAKEVLYQADQRIYEVYFPETCVICQMTVMENGDTLETATVGDEGASWISARIGAHSMPCQTIVAIAGAAQALRIEDLEREVEENSHFDYVLTTYSHALLIHCMRLVGCNGLHSLEQRCARWMLSTLDKVSADRFSVTHEFLARLLGASRPSVSTMLKAFEDRGMLRTESGHVFVGDRASLLTASCECYQVIKENYEHVGR